MSYHDTRPLPSGWVEQHNSDHNRTFWVDTNANPPRSIWTHPLDDPEFQRTSQGSGGGYQPPPGPPPSHSESTYGQQSSHTYPNEKATYSASPAPALSHSNSVGSSSGQQYGGADKTKSGGGGLFGKIKAKINEVKQPRPQQYGGGGYGGGGYGGQQQYGGYPQQGYGQQQQYGGYQQQGRMGGGMMGGGGRMGGGGGMNPALMLGGGLLAGGLMGGMIADGQNDAYQDGYDDGGGGGDDGGGGE